MSKLVTAGMIVTALAFSVAAEDWYHEREERFRGEGGALICSCMGELISNTFGPATATSWPTICAGSKNFRTNTITRARRRNAPRTVRYVPIRLGPS